MKHKIYIDNNDEITTIVEKLRAAQAVDIVMVVSQNSLLLESVINIRLLRREAMKGRKKITLATHDEEGALLAEKVGIPVDRNYSEYSESEENVVQTGEQELQLSPPPKIQPEPQIKVPQPIIDERKEVESDSHVPEVVAVAGMAAQSKAKSKSKSKTGPTMDGMVVQKSQVVVPQQQVQTPQESDEKKAKELEEAWSEPRVAGASEPQKQEEGQSPSENDLAASLGTEQFFSASQQREGTEASVKDGQEYERSLINADLVTGASIDMGTKDGKNSQKKKRNTAAAVVTVQQAQKVNDPIQNDVQSPEQSAEQTMQAFAPVRETQSQTGDTKPSQEKEELLSDFYQQHDQKRPIKKNTKKTNTFHKSSGIFARLTKIVAVLAIILAIATSVFIILPKTDMHIVLKRATEMADLTIDAVTSADSVDIERRIIPGKMIAIDVTQTASFPATQEITSSQQKSRGQITLYNEFSAEKQQLVATTRLESSDGKIFRLVKGVMIPGMTDGDPGTIKVDVVADASGSEYDIEPDQFTIPGLEGSQKMRKIYGKSDKAMRGGGSGGDELLAVSEQDLEDAQKKMEETFADDIRVQIATVVEENGGGIFLEDTVEVGEITGNASVAVETAVDSFDYTLTAPVKVISFSGDDVYTILDAAIIKKIDSESMVPEGDLTIVYGDAEAKYDKEELSLDVKGEGAYVAQVDEAIFREDVLGKTIEEITTIVHDKYASIERIDFNFTPNISFLTNKLSSLDKMLIITFE